MTNWTAHVIVLSHHKIFVKRVTPAAENLTSFTVSSLCASIQGCFAGILSRNFSVKWLKVYHPYNALPNDIVK